MPRADPAAGAHAACSGHLAALAARTLRVRQGRRARRADARALAAGGVAPEFHELAAAAGARLVFLAHFGWGKTSNAVMLCAWLICVRRGIRILYVSPSHGEGVKRTRLLLAILKSLVVRQMFPDLEIERESDSQVQVARKTIAKDPTFQAVGIGSEFLGARVDLIVLDDVSTLEDSQSETVRTRKVEIVRSTLLPRLAPAARRSASPPPGRTATSRTCSPARPGGGSSGSPWSTRRPGAGLP